MAPPARRIALAVNFGNIGHVSFRPAFMQDWLAEVNRMLEHGGSRTHLIGYFAHTGNFVVESHTEEAALAEELSRVLATPCAVTSISGLQRYLQVLRSAKCPAAEPGIRWTSGAVFHVSGTSVTSPPTSTARARYARLSDQVIAAWKRDHLDSHGRLDRNRRSGGWGGLALDIARQLGGTWTARSARTLRGVLSRAMQVAA